MKKITQREIPFLDEGTYAVDRGVFLRKRGKYGSFFLRVQVNGERHDVSLGSAKDITITTAKIHAVKIRSQIADGDFPWKQEKAKKEKHLFKDVLSDAVDVIGSATHWKHELRMRNDWINSLTDYCVPVFGKKDVADITRDDVLNVLGEIWTEKHDLGKKIRSRLERIFSLMLVRGWRTNPNPAVWKGNLELFLAPTSKVHEVKHREAMTFEEACLIARRFRHSDFTSHRAVLFGLLTCSRTVEFVKARWGEIDLENGVWSCPRERMKVSRCEGHRVPLQKQLIDLLREWRGGANDDEFLFKGSSSATISLETPRMILIKNLHRKVTMHGCRSTFCVWCAESGVPEELAEISLAHQSGSEVRRAYQRSDLLELRRPVLQAWADALFNEEK